MNSEFFRQLGLDYPIFQAPAGSLAGPELAAAVSNAGGMGALALTWTSPEDATRLIQEVRSQCDRLFQVNFVLAFPPKSLTAALDAGVKIFTFSWGDPSPYLSQVRAAGAYVGMQVTNIAGARRAIELGVDFLICQGVEAGGHVQSTSPLWEILPQILAVASDVPAIAAGGISTGKSIAQALSLGASGVMLGTRFVATQESRAHLLYKQRLTQAKANEAVLTVCFDGGWPNAAHRVLRNPTLDTWEAFGCPPSGKRPGEGDIVATTASGQIIRRYEDLSPRVDMSGNLLDMCLYAGKGCEEINDIPSVADLLARLEAECQTNLKQNPA
jgi:nitronate monooxygenase